MLRVYAVRCLLLNPLLFTIPKTVPAPFSDPRIRFRGSHKRIRTQSVLSHTACRLSRSTSAQAQPRSRPEGGRRSARPTPQRAASRRGRVARVKIVIFSLHVHIVTGTGGLWQVSEAPKYFRRDNPPPLTPSPTRTARCGSSDDIVVSTGCAGGKRAVPSKSRHAQHAGGRLLDPRLGWLVGAEHQPERAAALPRRDPACQHARLGHHRAAHRGREGRAAEQRSLHCRAAGWHAV